MKPVQLPGTKTGESKSTPKENTNNNNGSRCYCTMVSGDNKCWPCKQAENSKD